MTTQRKQTRWSVIQIKCESVEIERAHKLNEELKRIELIKKRMQTLGVNVVLASHWGEGGKGAAELAKVVVDLCES